MDKKIITYSDSSYRKHNIYIGWKQNSSKFGNIWVSIDSKNFILVEGNNPAFETITKIYSHRSEIFGLILALILIDKYCSYYFLWFNPQLHYYYDNLEVIMKLKKILIIIETVMMNYIKQQIMI